jgi:hypothetical protein
MAQSSFIYLFISLFINLFGFAIRFIYLVYLITYLVYLFDLFMIRFARNLMRFLSRAIQEPKESIMGC